MASGEQKNPFLLSDIYKIYVDIMAYGTCTLEFNTKQMMTTIKTEHTTCPLSRKCDEGIRCLQPDEIIIVVVLLVMIKINQ